MSKDCARFADTQANFFNFNVNLCIAAYSEFRGNACIRSIAVSLADRLLGEANMKSITIRKVPEPVHRQLRIRAAKNGRSLEAELRTILLRLARIEDDSAKKSTATASNKKLTNDSAGQSEITLSKDEISLGADAAMHKVRKILRENTSSEAEAA